MVLKEEKWSLFANSLEIKIWFVSFKAGNSFPKSPTTINAATRMKEKLNFR